MLPLESRGVNGSRSLRESGQLMASDGERRRTLGDNQAWPATTSCTGHNAFGTSRLLLALLNPHRPCCPSPARQPTKPRVSRPKPPRDEDAEQLLRLCREGRLFELQAWVAAGKSLSVPAHYRQTPMRVALNTGFHSLIEFLLQHEAEPVREG